MTPYKIQNEKMHPSVLFERISKMIASNMSAVKVQDFGLFKIKSLENGEKTVVFEPSKELLELVNAAAEWQPTL